MIEIRAATTADLPAINSIYNHFVEHSTSTYETLPSTVAERSAWFAAHGPPHPVRVATDRNEIVGWGSISPFHARQAFAATVEHSLYVRHDRHGQGIGTRLLAELMAAARSAGHHTMIAVIDAEQEASLRLHLRAGFTPAGRLKQAGRKFDRWLNVVYLQLVFDDA